jgi:hypothetical protein
MPKPILVGYQTIRIDTSSDDVARGRQLLAEFAAREGFALTEIYVERDPNRPCSALTALIEAARRDSIAAVAVPTLDDLGRLPRVRRIMRDRLQRDAGVRVLVVEPVATPDQVVELVLDGVKGIRPVRGRRP